MATPQVINLFLIVTASILVCLWIVECSTIFDVHFPFPFPTFVKILVSGHWSMLEYPLIN